MKKTARHVLQMLAILAMLGVQVWGLHRGFICDCGGVERLTMIDHCHGPHDHDCEQEEHEMPLHDRHDHDEEAPVHDHPALVEALQAEKASSAAFCAPQAPVLVFLPLEVLGFKKAVQAKAARFQPPRPESRAGPLWPPRLSRSIMLLI